MTLTSANQGEIREEGCSFPGQHTTVFLTYTVKQVTTAKAIPDTVLATGQAVIKTKQNLLKAADCNVKYS